MPLKFIIYPDPMLTQISHAVTPEEFTPELSNLAADMLGMVHERNGFGLSAVQIGRPIRLFVMGNERAKIKALIAINPVFTFLGHNWAQDRESCYSLPGITAIVRRRTRVVLDYYDTGGGHHQAELVGLAARIAQHVMDHLDGKSLLDACSKSQRAKLMPGVRALFPEIRQQ